jgi:hypothetical protein
METLACLVGKRDAEAAGFRPAIVLPQPGRPLRIDCRMSTRMVVRAREAVQRANACRDRSWRSWVYDEAHRSFVITTGPVYEDTLYYLICWDPSYIRVSVLGFEEGTEFQGGLEAAARMRRPPPACFLIPGEQIVVIRAGGEEYCVVCGAIEFRSFSAPRGEQ